MRFKPAARPALLFDFGCGLQIHTHLQPR
jgi:hypothetical protein